MKKKSIKKLLKKQWLLIWTLAVSIAMMTIIASAEYGTTTSSMHRVVVSKKGPGMMFSSNYLIEGGDAVYHPIYVKEKSEGAYSDNYLFLWNYNTSDLERFYPEDINYRIEVALTDQNGTALTKDIGNKTIRITDPDNHSVTLSNSVRSGTLSSQKLVYSSTAAQNRFTIAFSERWDLVNDEDVCVQIKAVPTTRNGGGSYSDLSTISGIVGLKTTSSTVSNGWKASISEQPTTAGSTDTPSDFDAYNLVLTGSGSATIKIKWNTQYIKLNKYFTDEDNRVYDFAEGEIEYEPDGNVWQEMTINADTSNDAQENRNRYMIQLYKTGAGDYSDPTDPWRFFANNKADDVYQDAWIRVNIT